MCFKKKKEFDLVGHPECSHNFINYAKKQCEWDMQDAFYNNRKADSKNICNMYICTMCGGEYWSSNKSENIPHYRVKTINKIDINSLQKV